MDKINTQKFNLSVNKNDVSKTDDVLGALFSIPVTIDDKQVNGDKVNEFIVNSSIEKILSSKKALKNFGKIEIMYKDFFSGTSKNQFNNSILKNEEVFDFNSKKIPNILNINVKSDKLLKINYKRTNLESKLSNNEIVKDLDLKINPINESEKNLNGSLDKSKLMLNSNNNLTKKINSKKNSLNKQTLNDIFSKIDRLKDDISSNNFENKIIINDSDIIYKRFKVFSESNNLSHHSDQLNKIENLTLRNNSSQHQFNGDKNINFVLDQMIDELDMSKLGWTEKLILRIEKGLKEDEKLIELALKPKELGNLKINLKIKDQSANIVMKVENAASMVALQSNEGLLAKTLSDQGFILEKVNFENSLMNSNKENENSSANNKDNNLKKNEKTILDDFDNNKDDNSNYLININA